MDDATLLSWIERGQNFAALLVAIGVAGEFLLGFMAGPARKRVDAARDAEIVQLMNGSAKAGERAAQLEQSNIKLQISLEQVKRSAGQRYLSSDEQNQLVTDLEMYHVRNIQIWCKLTNSEAARFGDDFERVFTRLHWNPNRAYVSDANIQVVGNKRIDEIASLGLVIGVDDPKHPPKAAIALQRSLRNLDFPFDARISGPWWTWGTAKPDPEYFRLAIGTKE
jgi:hypothetical protein